MEAATLPPVSDSRLQRGRLASSPLATTRLVDDWASHGLASPSAMSVNIWARASCPSSNHTHEALDVGPHQDCGGDERWERSCRRIRVLCRNLFCRRSSIQKFSEPKPSEVPGKGPLLDGFHGKFLVFYKGLSKDNRISGIFQRGVLDLPVSTAVRPQRLPRKRRHPPN